MDTTPVHLIEVTPRELPGLQDTRGESIRSMLSADHNLTIETVRSITGYQVKAKLSAEQLLQSLQDLFTDPIIEQGTVNNSLLDVSEIFPEKPDLAIMIGFKPGVTDSVKLYATVAQAFQNSPSGALSSATTRLGASSRQCTARCVSQRKHSFREPIGRGRDGLCTSAFC